MTAPFEEEEQCWECGSAIKPGDTICLECQLELTEAREEKDGD